MDIEALRLAALSSKRRRKADDVEEGEIDSDAPTTTLNIGSRPSASPESAQPRQPRHGSLSPRPAASAAAAKGVSYPPAASAPSLVHGIKEESKGIIAQLLSYGVTPEYLISVGVSRDIIDISFHELGLAPPSLLALPVAAGPPAINPNFHRGGGRVPPLYDDAASIDEQHRVYNTSPPPPALLLASTSTPNPDLALIEAHKREELLARKAANAARNKQKALSLESELENLFASATSAPLVKVESDEGSTMAMDVDSPSAEPEIEIDHGADLGALRRSLARTEETVDGPPAGPFGASERDGSRSSSRRPVAVDFEAGPTISLPPSVSTRAGPSYVTDMPAKMVIDLSESEGEEEERDREEQEGARVQDKGAEALAIGRDEHEDVQATAEEEGSSEARHKLEEKESEIQRIMERIAQMEKKKSRSTPSRQSSVPAASIAPLDSSSASESAPRSLPPPPQTASELEHARKQVRALEAERSTLAAAVQEDDLPTRADNEGADSPTDSASEDGSESEDAMTIETVTVASEVEPSRIVALPASSSSSP